MAAPENSTCPHCKLPLREYHDFITCPTCRTSYHERCWQENGGCPRCATAAAPMAEDNPDGALSWYLFHDHKNLGPLTWEQLCSHNGIQPDDLVWNSRLSDWIKAGEIPDLPLGRRSPESGGKPAKGQGAAAETAATAAAASGESAAGGGGGMAESTPPLQQKGDRLGDQNSTLAEQILEQLYANETCGPVPEDPVPDNETTAGGEIRRAANGHIRHIIYGALLSLGGLIVLVATTHNPAERSIFFYIASGWALLFGIADLLFGVVGILKGR